MREIVNNLLCILIVINLYSYNKDDWKEMKNFKSRVEIEKELWYCLSKDMKIADIDPEGKRLKREEFELLQEYFSEYYQTPVIMAEIKPQFVKKYRIFQIRDPFQYEYDAQAPRVFAMEKRGKFIYIFGSGLKGRGDSYLFNKFPQSDIKFFNKILEEELKEVITPELALDIGVLFAKVCEHIENELATNWQTLVKSIKNKDKEDRFKTFFHSPKYKTKDNKIELKFFTFSDESEDGINSLSEWHLEISKNGRVRLLNFEYIW